MLSVRRDVISKLVVMIISIVLASGCVHSMSRDQSQLDRLAAGFLQTLSKSDKAAFGKASRVDLPLCHVGAGSRVHQIYFGPDGEGRTALCARAEHCDMDKQSMRIVELTREINHDAG